MKKPIQCPKGIAINDVVTLFKGDFPARQFKAGQKKSGYISFLHLVPYIHTMLKTYASQIQKKCHKSTTMAQIKLQKQQLKLYNRLSKTEIINELHQRAEKIYFHSNKKRSHRYSEL